MTAGTRTFIYICILATVYLALNILEGNTTATQQWRLNECQSIAAVSNASHRIKFDTLLPPISSTGSLLYSLPHDSFR